MKPSRETDGPPSPEALAARLFSKGPRPGQAFFRCLGGDGVNRAGTLDMTKNALGPSFQDRRRSNYPIGIFVRVRLISGREVEAQIVKIEITTLGTFLHVEFGEEVANVTARQVVGYYDFCPIKVR